MCIALKGDEIVTKILISGALNTRIGNAEIRNIVGLLENQ